MKQIKNIIFDLGGVLINLDIPATIAAYDAICEKPFESIYTQLKQTPLFDRFDKGSITELDFFTELKKTIKTNADIDQLKKAWNTMLLDFPPHRLELLKTLGKHYRLFLLSNTNETHITVFEQTLKTHYNCNNLEPFFEKVYYSCRMNMRKPNVEIFNYVLKENDLSPEQTLFIDDTQQHIDGALKAGIYAHLLEKGKDVGELIKELKL